MGLLIIHHIDPGEQERPFGFVALDQLGGGYDGHPLLDVLFGGIAFLTEQRQIFFGAFPVALQAEQQVGSGGIRGGVALSCVGPVQNVGGTVTGNNDIGGVKITVADLTVLRRAVQMDMQVVAGGCVQSGGADLAVHFVLQLVQHGAGQGVHFQLQIYEEAEVFVFLFRILLHELGQGLALDKFGHDGPFAVHYVNTQKLGDVQPGLLNAGMIQGLVQNVRLGKMLVKGFDAGISVPIDDLVGPGSNDSIHVHPVFLLKPYSRCHSRR